MKNMYSAKVLEGNWYNDRKLTSFEGVRPIVQTETQIRQAETTGLQVPIFGASLRSTYAHIKSVEDNLDYDNPVYPYKPYTAKEWSSITKLIHFAAPSGAPSSAAADVTVSSSSDSTAIHHTRPVLDDPATLFGSSYRMVRHELLRDPAALADYRARWINESQSALRTLRFTTTMNNALGAAVEKKFKVEPQRFLIGVPKSLEVLRTRTEEALGMDGILRLALQLPPTFRRVASSMVNPLRDAIIAMGITINFDQGNELWKYLDPLETLEVHTSDLLRGLLSHPIDPPRLEAIHRAYDNLCELAGRGNSVTMGTIAKTFDGNAHVDVRRKPVPRFSSKEGSARVYEGIAAVVAMRGGDSSVGASSSSSITVDDHTVVSYEAFEDYWAFIAAIMDDNDAFGRMLDMGFRISVPSSIANTLTSLSAATTVGPLPGGIVASSSSSLSTGKRTNSPVRNSSTGINSSPSASTRGPSLEQIAASSTGNRTTYSDLGSGLAYTSKPYKPKVRATSPSPNRRQSRAAKTIDADAEAATMLTNLVVLGIHNDGRKAMYKLPKDRFLDKKDTAGIISRLEKLGVQNLVDIKTDF